MIIYMKRKFKRSLTPKQKAILDFITTYTTGRGYAPSLEEIGKKYSISIPTAHQHVKALEKKGYLKKEENQPRGASLFEQTPDSIQIPMLGLIAAGSPIEPIENPEPISNPKNLIRSENQPRGVSLFEQTPDSIEIPMLGLIAAGSPIEPIENPEPISIPKNLISSRGDYYALRVKGNSMIEDGI